jgi:hypothetical protein
MKINYLITLVLLGLLLASCSPTFGISTTQSTENTGIVDEKISQEDYSAIQQTALDYIEGWYDGDVERMDRSLHADLVKRDIIANHQVHTLSKEEMVEYTRQGGGKLFPSEKKNVVTILDINTNIATVKVESPEYIDYLHMGKVDGKWVIINVLWAENRKQ